jgi:hypothetical protein
VGPNGTDISTDDGKNWQPLKPSPDDPPDADKNWNALSLPFAVGLCSIVDGNAAASELRVDLASPQVQKYLALRPSSCITQHLHTTVLLPPHNLSEQTWLWSGGVWRCTTCNLNCDGDLFLEATR